MDINEGRNVCIFCFYNINGVVDRGTMYLLSELRVISSFLVMVVNGKYIPNDECKRIIDRIIVKENKGYDAGAYKHVLEIEEIQDIIKGSDRLILCNNTFWGPFVNFEEICKKTEADGCDFYGITKIKINVVEHIQSFFLIFKRNIIEDKRFWDYFYEVVPDDCEYEEVLAVFENGLYKYLVDLGYKPGAFIDPIKCSILKNPHGSIAIDRVPVLKKKIFSDSYYRRDMALGALKSISDMYEYDVQIIIDDVSSEYDIYLNRAEIDSCSVMTPVSDIRQIYAVTRDEVLRFIAVHSKVYVYGIGENARKIFSQIFCFNDSKELAGFLVSDEVDINQQDFFGVPVYHLSESDENVGVIVALSRENTNSVREKLANRNCLFLWE